MNLCERFACVQSSPKHDLAVQKQTWRAWTGRRYQSNDRLRNLSWSHFPHFPPKTSFQALGINLEPYPLAFWQSEIAVETPWQSSWTCLRKFLILTYCQWTIILPRGDRPLEWTNPCNRAASPKLRSSKSSKSWRLPLEKARKSCQCHFCRNGFELKYTKKNKC